MPQKLRYIFFILMCLAISFSSMAQTKKELEKKRKQYQKELRQINTLLFKSKQQEEALLSELSDLNKRIGVRSRLIRTIDQEEEKLSEEIEKNNLQIKELESKLEKLKKEYANMIVKSYKSKSDRSKMMFLLSSENFAQAYKRLQYMNQYNSYRKKQGEQIKKNYQKLATLNDSLHLKKDEKVLLIALYTKEQDSVNREKDSQIKLVDKVKQEEKKYIAQARRIQKQENNINKQIQRMINEEIARANKKTNSKSSKVFGMTPEERLVAKTFTANKGKLPWPTERGVVVRRFGSQKHPTLAGIVINSHGLHIATQEKAQARAIFKGKILAIQLQPGRKKMVLVQHGNYISVYKNLSNVVVKKGQSINTKDPIGTIHTDAITGKTILELGLFKNSDKQNPESWISSKGSVALVGK